MPLLFSLAIHNALAEVKAQLNEGEYLFAFLVDIYVLAKPGRDIYNLLDERLFTRVGIQLHTGKTRTWNRAGVPPPRMEELGQRAALVEGDRLGSRSPVCMANPSPVRRPDMSPLFEDVATVSATADRLDRQGFVGRPSWADLKEGVRPPIPVSQEPGGWQHGWLCCWRGCVSHCTSQKLGASAAQGSTVRDATRQHVPDRVG